MAAAIVLSLIIFLPTLAALLLLFVPAGATEAIRRLTLGAALVVFLLSLRLILPGLGDPDNPLEQAVSQARFTAGEPGYQNVVQIPWIPSFDIYYFLGLDGLSLPLVILTAFLSVLAAAASWSITKHVKAYSILFLLLETGMLGVFTALDFFLFYVFWEVVLLPMYFLIGIWGGPRREYAAIKFFLFTLAGSVLMLIALLVMYYNSDVRRLSEQQRRDALLHESVITKSLAPSEKPLHTFNLPALAELGRLPDSPFAQPALFGKSLAWWCFLLLLIGFLIKVPSVPVHTWLPDAHVEAPTPISMILAGILLKMGGYGILRICYPIFPSAAYELAWLVCLLGLSSMVYGAFAAMAQKDFKRLVAYSSVSHMGYVVLGIGAWSLVPGVWDGQYWKMGMNGAMFQMVAHGLSSAGMFFLVGVLYDRVHHRDIDRFGGIYGRMPAYSALAFGLFFAALGLPGLCGFIGEILVVLASFRYSVVMAIIAASVMILTAGYILWTIQRVYLGPEYRGPHPEGLTPLTAREFAVGAALLIPAVVLGVYPQALFRYMAPSVDRTVDEITAWMRDSETAPQRPEWTPAADQPASTREAWLQALNSDGKAEGGDPNPSPGRPPPMPHVMFAATGEAFFLNQFTRHGSTVNLLPLLEQLEGDAYLSLRLFAPEGLVCVTMLLLLLSRMLLPSRRRLPYSLAFLGVVAALAAAVMQWPLLAILPHLPQTAVSGFTGLLRFDLLGLFFRILFFGFSAVFVVFLAMTRLPDDEDVGEFLVLYLASLLGLCVMASADHLLMVLLGMEMAGVPGYMLAGFIKSRRASGEAAVKFALFGAASAGTMLYGMTLLAGSLGSLHLPTIGARLAALTDPSAFAAHAPVLVLGLLMLLVGLAFKLSAVPFHFWVPDVFEGAAAEVGAYLSTVSKAGALILLIRVTAGLLGAEPTVSRLPEPAQFAAAGRTITAESAGLARTLPSAAPIAATPAAFVADRGGPPVHQADLSQAALPARHSPTEVVGRFWAAVIALLAAVSCTFGNLAAYGQKNFKRLLAYSTIAHAGYMLMPVAAAAMLWHSQPDLARWALAAATLYTAVYLIMNLGAFAATAFLRDAYRSETIDDFAGWVRVSPGLTVAVALIMFSLIGLPPLAGFAAKFAAFASLTYAGLWALLVIGAVNTALSLFYYLRVVKVMVLDPPGEAVAGTPPVVALPGVTFVSALAVALLVLGVLWQPLFGWAKAAAGLP